MVEVFSTNVKDRKEADFLLNQLGQLFPAYEINFDLDDCDNILRVKSDFEYINVVRITDLMEKHGFMAEVLPDVYASDDSKLLNHWNG